MVDQTASIMVASKVSREVVSTVGQMADERVLKKAVQMVAMMAQSRDKSLEH